MKKISAEQLAALPSAKDAIKVEINLVDLKDIGVGMVSYGIKLNDVIEFPDSVDDITLYKREGRAGQNNFEYLLAVLRNGKPSWLSLGCLRRTDVDRKLYGTVPNEFVGQSDEDRIKGLLGKKITATTEQDVKLPKFDNGALVAGESVDGKLPIIEYAA